MQADHNCNTPLSFDQFIKQLIISCPDSDSEIAIGGAALLDEQLYQLLAASLLGSQTQIDSLLNLAGRRKQLAYCIGLISPAEFEELGAIGKIRNRFAHDFPRPTFQSNAIRHLVSLLANYHAGLVDGLDRRDIYLGAVRHMSNRLAARLERVRRIRGVG